MHNTDAYYKQVKGFILQKQSGRLARLMRYWPGSLIKVEKTYHTEYKKCFAAVCDVLLFRPRLEGLRFTIRTDYKALW